MSTSTQLPTSDEIAATAKVAATKAVETGAYSAERTKQETGVMNAQANAPSHTSRSLDKFEEDMSAKTNQAVEQGKSDVHHAAQTSEGYLEKALHMVDAGLSATQGYLVAGKERLTAPAVGGEPPATTGIGAQLASTATAALDVAARGVGYAQHTLHERGPGFPHAQTHEPAHPVTIPAKPMGQALADNASAAQSTVQPHLDSAKATAQPHLDNAKAASQPYVDATAANVNAAAAGLQGQVDAVKGAMASDKPLTQQVQEAGQAAVDTAKPYVAAAGDSASSTMQATGERLNSATTTSKPGDPTYTV